MSNFNSTIVDVPFSGDCDCGRTVRRTFEERNGTMGSTVTRKIRCRRCREIVVCTPTRQDEAER